MCVFQSGFLFIVTAEYIIVTKIKIDTIVNNLLVLINAATGFTQAILKIRKTRAMQKPSEAVKTKRSPIMPITGFKRFVKIDTEIR